MKKLPPLQCLERLAGSIVAQGTSWPSDDLPLDGVDPHWFRGNSYFRIGWDWLKAALENGWPLIRHVCFTHNRNPEPARASRKQHEQRTYRIEFKIHIYCYAAD